MNTLDAMSVSCMRTLTFENGSVSGMNTLDAMLEAIVLNPLEETRWLVLADWLEEYDDPRRSELLRLHRQLLATCCESEHSQRARWHARIVELLGAGVRPCVPQRTLQLPGDVPMTFSFIPPGRYRRGSDQTEARDAEKPSHMVILNKGFFLGIVPVTLGQWKAVMRSEPSVFRYPNRPVENVSWDDTQAFCQQSMAGLNEQVMVRLPTEAEWEYACRAGTTTAYHFGDAINTDLANFNGRFSSEGFSTGRFRRETTDVGTFPANPWGLFDVHGNVWEWCADWFGPYSAEAQSNPFHATIYSDNSRSLRGGCWGGDPEGCRATARAGDSPARRSIVTGFRVCISLD